MMTFDAALRQLLRIIDETPDARTHLEECIINRDLYGRISLIIPEGVENAAFYEEFQKTLHNALDFYCSDIFRESPETISAMRESPIAYSPQGFDAVRIIDRLAAENDWLSIAPIPDSAPRFVFYSIKGGVGRSSALAATAWKLAEEGKRVLVMDLDLESPGLSTALLPDGRRPAYGIVDWLVEDLHDNGDALLDSMYASSPLSHNGEIFVIPAHGADPGEYIQKLGRVWLPKATRDGESESWPKRLARLVAGVENAIRPDVVLIDSRAGIDEVAATCVTVLGATTIFLFAIDNEQTWSGYRLLFRHWNTANRTGHIRDRLQVVGGLVPTGERGHEYFRRLLENSAFLFSEELYEEIPPGELDVGIYNFAEDDPSAPHFPRVVLWHEAFSAMGAFGESADAFDARQAELVFGPLLDAVFAAMESTRGNNGD